ncbi:hypothetical protein [Alkalicoccus daliensis]|uniref:Uncharacterized protein n=1 Tax=Alkalicoccus daliensis TaxID=745820 RepID=A0A1H0CYQ5_9BACI|nr:hypothetical protein [Alkalicoccus daliensis]SDN63037.1 hypothetical protein SAMN04488053_102280 [Alkalicoccus daliensis]
MKRVFAYFLVATICFGGIMSLIIQNFSLGMTSGLIFGSLNTLFNGTIHYVNSVKLGINPNAPLKAKKELIVAMPENEAIQACREALDQLENIRTVKQEEKHRITATTEASLMTLGESMSCEFTRHEAEQTRVSIISKPKLSTTMIDDRSSHKNLQRLAAALPREKVISQK